MNPQEFTGGSYPITVSKSYVMALLLAKVTVALTIIKDQPMKCQGRRRMWSYPWPLAIYRHHHTRLATPHSAIQTFPSVSQKKILYFKNADRYNYLQVQSFHAAGQRPKAVNSIL
jgi:dolichyl-phosphate-mannose--protein O-mannosyl transferase